MTSEAQENTDGPEEKPYVIITPEFRNDVDLIKRVLDGLRDLPVA